MTFVFFFFFFDVMSTSNIYSSAIGEAIGKMLVGKRISNKIDYEKLKDLSFIFGSTSSSTTSNLPSDIASEPKVEPSTPVASSRSR